MMTSPLSHGFQTSREQLATGVSIIDEDIILALTEGLPQSFSTFIVTLDSLLKSELSLDNVVTRVLNDEV